LESKLKNYEENFIALNNQLREMENFITLDFGTH
jgi:hypothetical protein